ncbi:serine carboxypeptidase-like [Iris pallida]|uniref:Serine carboxypeptidase-like n=1 Tax=Iris pallida TaxID=29817 RepID=A0AAX6FZ20_IRIPA|nr:serine carboxypeptidase-like [Iris pallida]
MGLIGKAAYDIIKKIYLVCESSIKLYGSSGIITCVASYVLCNSIFTSIMLLAGNINPMWGEDGEDQYHKFASPHSSQGQSSSRRALHSEEGWWCTFGDCEWMKLVVAGNIPENVSLEEYVQF